MYSLTDLQIGDIYPWIANASPQSGGRPVDGDAVGDGNCVCPRCSLDFFVNVIVQQDVIRRLEIDGERRGYLPNPS